MQIYYWNPERFQLCPIFIFEATGMANSMRFEVKHGLDFFWIGDLQSTKIKKVVDKLKKDIWKSFSGFSRVNTSPQWRVMWRSLSFVNCNAGKKVLLQEHERSQKQLVERNKEQRRKLQKILPFSNKRIPWKIDTNYPDISHFQCELNLKRKKKNVRCFLH